VSSAKNHNNILSIVSSAKQLAEKREMERKVIEGEMEVERIEREEERRREVIRERKGREIRGRMEMEIEKKDNDIQKMQFALEESRRETEEQKKELADRTEEIEGQRKELANTKKEVLQKEASYYSKLHFKFLATSIAILVALIAFVLFVIFPETFEVKNLLKFVPLAIPVYVIFGVYVSRANHYSHLSSSYRHKARVLDLTNVIPPKHEAVHEKAWMEMIALDNTKKPDDTKKALKLLEEINKIMPKK
jgi:hypothetical protein